LFLLRLDESQLHVAQENRHQKPDVPHQGEKLVAHQLNIRLGQISSAKKALVDKTLRDFASSNTGKPRTVLVSAEFAMYVNPPPLDGNTYIIENPRRPWLKHVSCPRLGVFTLDTRKQKLKPRLSTNFSVEALQSDPTDVHSKRSDQLPVKLIRLQTVLEMIGRGKSYVYEHAGIDFPSPIKSGTSRRASSRWLESEVVAWVNRQASNRPTQVNTI
jgi:predicted DNA-binding transcriptional regulator AlpA